MPNPQQNQSGIRIAGDFKLNSVQLRPYNGALPLDLTNVREEINIYEDIYSNFITGDIGIWDTWDLTQLFPLIGEETLILSFNRPGTKPQGNSVGGGLAAAAMETVKETEDYTINITTTTGVNEIGNETNFDLFPNPSKGRTTGIQKKRPMPMSAPVLSSRIGIMK